MGGSSDTRALTEAVRAAVAACWAGTLDDGAWADGVLAALAPFDRGLGLVAAARDACGRAAVLASRPVDGALAAAVRVAPSGALEHALFGLPDGVAHLSRLVARSGRAAAHGLRAWLDGLGACDGVVLRAGSGPRRVAIAIPAPAPVPPAIARRLRALAAHLSCALELRARVAIADAAGAARTCPARLVERVHAVPAQGRPDPQAVWSELLAGSWSVVDLAARPGSRMLLVRRVHGRDGAALTARERDALAYALHGLSNKAIAWALGVSTPTAAAHLRAAGAKLGLSTRRALVQLFSGATAGTPDGGNARRTPRW